MLAHPDVCAEYESLTEEFAVAEAVIRARANMTQAQGFGTKQTS